MSALSDSLRDLSKGLSTLAVVVGPNHPLVAADPLNESADLCEEAAMTIEGYESKLATLTARCAELEGRVSTQSIALEAIAGMTIDDSTDHAQLSALMKAIAKQSVEGAI